MVGDRGCQEGLGHCPYFKAFPRGFLVAPTLSCPVLSCHSGGGRCCFIAEASGRPPEGPPGRFRGGAAGALAAASQ